MKLELQIASEATGLPAENDLRRWAETALEDEDRRELVIRIVDEAESRQLNRDYRGRDKPTNVLSFPFEAPPEVPVGHLGDLVICAPVVAREAVAQGKPLAHHWAHMVVHGILHLRGYDHLEDTEAEIMENRERELLAGMSIPDPYREEK
ncbi:rRNA maturation RNase YbeY [Thiolapillus brandeum]|uniref:Endoribonuclease YbeY n=1 Tax=Thiolapillus brandeum TaxID=1076588 RepID=A0A7U6GLA3_9GAMM|nr:rRNA maturation RNase YbeY [Thiolapillus brandeum]BAO45748.1 metal-dependent hydrolase [Thiolapillus brandeum]